MQSAPGILNHRAVTRQLGGEPAYAADIACRISGGDLTVHVVTKNNDTNSFSYFLL